MSRMIRKVMALVVAAALGVLGVTSVAPPAQALGSVNLTGYGGDSCTAPSTSQMSAFWNNTRFSYWGVYIGGSTRGCAQPNLTASWVTTVTNQGWDLLPFWVGPQSPCYGGSSTFSIDPATAYNQGRAEALSAYNAWRAISSVSDVPIDYDLEGPSTNTASCRAAAKSFINGWVEQLHVAPAQPAGVYSSACAGAIDDFSSIANPPDFIDAADWDGDPSTGNISCVSSTHWTGLRRHKQYQGDHNETMNGVTLNIDSRCSNGPVFGAVTHTSSTHACAPASLASADATAAAARADAPVTWKGTQWRSGGPLSSQLQTRSVTATGTAGTGGSTNGTATNGTGSNGTGSNGTTAKGTATNPSGSAGTTANGTATNGSWRPVPVASLPVRDHEVPVTAATIGTPSVLPDGTLLVPVTTHPAGGSSVLLYTSTDGVTFTQRGALRLGSTLAPGVGAPTAVAGPDVVLMDPTDVTVRRWSGSGAMATTTAPAPATGLPAAPESMTFTDAQHGEAVVTVSSCGAAGKSGCVSHPQVLQTVDGGHSWR